MQSFNTFDGLRLAFRDEGDGLPLLCLAGLTRDSRDFDYVAPHLTDVRLIRMDYRGRGASEWADDPMTYAIPTEAQDALALLDHLNIEKAAILGTSRGGLIAMAIAATAKDRLSGVCLNDIGPKIDQTGLDRIMQYVGRNPTFNSQIEMAAAMPAAMPGFANVTAERWRQEVHNHTLESPQGLQITYDPTLKSAMQSATELPAPDLWPLFDALTNLPLALIRGANSDLLSPKTTAEMRRRRPDMIFAEIEDRAHVPFLDESPAVTAIQNWLGTCK